MPVVINNIGNYPDGKLTVDPTSKAMRIISYDSAGDCIDNVADGFPEFGGSFIAPWENRSTTVLHFLLIYCQENGTNLQYQR